MVFVPCLLVLLHHGRTEPKQPYAFSRLILVTSLPKSIVIQRALMRKAAMARNTSLTYGGKTPLELAFGRRPRDVITVENSNPEQLSHDQSKPEITDQKFFHKTLILAFEANSALCDDTSIFL